jgi:hypothetical protein
MDLCNILPRLPLEPLYHYGLDFYIRLKSTLWEFSLDGSMKVSEGSTRVLFPNDNVWVLECQHQPVATRKRISSLVLFGRLCTWGTDHITLILFTPLFYHLACGRMLISLAQSHMITCDVC